mmetsp:Transcript_1961/g.5336  ORF Transcript_1961/g.5336 Transcript_1961/m.5336 type:complete len:354 (-) Transcript_1961:4-1065(-)
MPVDHLGQAFRGLDLSHDRGVELDVLVPLIGGLEGPMSKFLCDVYVVLHSHGLVSSYDPNVSPRQVDLAVLLLVVHLEECLVNELDPNPAVLKGHQVSHVLVILLHQDPIGDQGSPLRVSLVLPLRHNLLDVLHVLEELGGVIHDGVVESKDGAALFAYLVRRHKGGPCFAEPTRRPVDAVSSSVRGDVLELLAAVPRNEQVAVKVGEHFSLSEIVRESKQAVRRPLQHDSRVTGIQDVPAGVPKRSLLHVNPLCRLARGARQGEVPDEHHGLPSPFLVVHLVQHRLQERLPLLGTVVAGKVLLLQVVRVDGPGTLAAKEGCGQEGFREESSQAMKSATYSTPHARTYLSATL